MYLVVSFFVCNGACCIAVQLMGLMVVLLRGRTYGIWSQPVTQHNTEILSKTVRAKRLLAETEDT